MTRLDESGSMRTMPCPACNSSEASHSHTNVLRFRGRLELSAWLCHACGHRWLGTSPEIQREIEKAYNDRYTGFRVDHYFNQVVSGELKKRLAGVKPPPAGLLDVGCGNGEFLALAKAAGYDTEGIDVSPTAGNVSRGKGLAVVAGDFLSHDFGRTFDIVTMWDVMEHLQSPADFVARARSVLTPTGVLVLKIPCKGGLNFAILRALPRRGGVLLGAPNHIQFFTERSLARLLKRCGFAEVLWLEHKKFRRRPKTGNPLKVLARSGARIISRVASDRNLYAIVAKHPFQEDVLKSVRHQSLERLNLEISRS